MQELLYLYGFVIESNPDDYLMVIFASSRECFKIKMIMISHVLLGITLGFIQVHYPVEAIPSIPFSDSKGQLLDAQVRSTSLVNEISIDLKSSRCCIL